MVKIHFGNLPDDCHEDSIRDILHPFGNVSDIKIVRNYGFANVTPEEAASKAVEALNKTKLYGKEISVEFARKQRPKNEDRRPSARPMRNSSSSAPQPMNNSAGLLGISPLLLSTVAQTNDSIPNFLNSHLQQQQQKTQVDNNSPDPDVRVRREVVHVSNVPNADRYGFTNGYVIHERYYVLPTHPLLKGLPVSNIPLMSETNCVRASR